MNMLENMRVYLGQGNPLVLTKESLDVHLKKLEVVLAEMWQATLGSVHANMYN